MVKKMVDLTPDDVDKICYYYTGGMLGCSLICPLLGKLRRVGCGRFYIKNYPQRQYNEEIRNIEVQIIPQEN